MAEFSEQSSVDAVLGKYQLLVDLGHGGMADVFLAVARGPAGFNKLCVTKVLRRALETDADFVAMFLDEARLAARLNHPNVVQTYEVGDEAGRYLIVMEYLEGHNLATILGRAHKHPEWTRAHTLTVFLETLAGLHYAHDVTDFDGTALNLVHRDVSPQNIFVTYEGHSKILDFGIAKAASSSAETRTGVLKGKIRYMAPEQITGSAIDRRADIYSMGVLLWEAAAGTRLWSGVADVAIMHRVVNALVPEPMSVNPSCPPRLNEIVCKALARVPDQRYASCLELLRDLERYLQESNEVISSRDLGHLVARLFANERKTMRTLVERQLADVQSLSGSGNRRAPVVVIAAPLFDATDPVASMTPSDASRRLRAPPFTDATATPSVHATRKRPPWTGIAVGALVAAVAGTALVLGARSGSSVRVASAVVAPTAAPLEPSPATSAAPPPALQRIAINIRTIPPDARLHLDNAPMANPVVQSVLRDPLTHTLRIEAPGYFPRSIPLTYNADFNALVSLDRVPAAPVERRPSRPSPAPAVAPAAPPAVAATPPPPNEPSPKANSKPSRKLDPNLPW